MGLVGHKVDSIDYWRAQSEELHPQVEAEQRHTRQALEQDAAIVIFNDRRSATEAAQVCLFSFLSFTNHRMLFPHSYQSV